jgi:hypothetical protein
MDRITAGILRNVFLAFDKTRYVMEQNMLIRLPDLEDRSSGFPISIRLRVSLLTVLLLILTGCVPARGFAADCTPPTQLPPSEAGQPRNLSGLKSELNYYQCSGAYLRDITRVIDEAIAYVTKRAKEGGKLAIVLDIDETSLSNWDEMKANDFGLIENGSCNLTKPDASGQPLPDSPCGFAAWVLEADAKPLVDTRRLYEKAKENHVAVFFITGRADANDHKVREATIENLHKAGYPDWTELLLKPAGDPSTIQEFKTAKRKEITEKGYTIIANVGDQYSDLKGGYAERIYKLPNPFYFVH